MVEAEAAEQDDTKEEEAEADEQEAAQGNVGATTAIDKEEVEFEDETALEEMNG